MIRREQIEVDVPYCDICKKKAERLKNCKDCGKDICRKYEYQSSGYCKSCWAKDYTIAKVEAILDDSEHGYESRTYTFRNLIKNSVEWHKLLYRFSGKKVKITSEECREE